jgi:hypothetical protein
VPLVGQLIHDAIGGGDKAFTYDIKRQEGSMPYCTGAAMMFDFINSFASTNEAETMMHAKLMSASVHEYLHPEFTVGDMHTVKLPPGTVPSGSRFTRYGNDYRHRLIIMAALVHHESVTNIWPEHATKFVTGGDDFIGHEQLHEILPNYFKKLNIQLKNPTVQRFLSNVFDFVPRLNRV